MPSGKTPAGKRSDFFQPNSYTLAWDSAPGHNQPSSGLAALLLFLTALPPQFFFFTRPLKLGARMAMAKRDPEIVWCVVSAAGKHSRFF